MKKIIVLILFSTFLSCSSKDSESNNIGGFQVGNDYFNTPYVYLNDENILNDNPSDLAIILSNKYLLVDNIQSGINILYIDYRGVNFETGDKSLLNYRITENASRVNGFIEGGTRLLDDSFNSNLNATQIEFVINSITSTNIDLNFSFTREDGKLISGEYSGTYTNVSR